MRVTFLLCDAAQESGGKLYILGGGWSMQQGAGEPFNMALAIQISIPWDQANQEHNILAKLMSADGDQVEVEGDVVQAQATVEVGRPAGLKPGMDLDLPMALNFAGLVLDEGGYRWELLMNDEQVAIAPFRVTE